MAQFEFHQITCSPFVYHIRDEDKHVDLEELSTNPEMADENFCESLWEAFKIQECKRIIASERVVMFLDNTLRAYLNDGDVLKHVHVFMQILRAFRICAAYQYTQNFMVHKTNLVTNLKKLFDKVVELDKENFVLHILLQVLHNSIVYNDKAAYVINMKFSDSLHFCILNKIFVSDALAVLYNISLYMEIKCDLINDYIIEHHSDDFYYVLILSQIVKNVSFWKSYDSRTIKHKDFIMNHLIHSETPLIVHEIGIDYFASQLLKYFDSFFKNTISGHIHDFSMTLKLLGTLSSNECNLPTLQRNKDLLIQCSVFLINMHRAEGSATPVKEAQFPKEMSLLYNFKADLVRLIGNMCYRNTKMQDLARRAEVIPVLTASSRIDEMNPFLEQWCVLALRNLCESNKENQELIRGIVNATTEHPEARL